MSHQQMLKGGLVMTFMMLLLGGCRGATPTPTLLLPVPTQVLPNPTAAPPIATDIPPTEPPASTTTEGVATDVAATDLTTTVEQTATLATVAPTENAIDQPFLMKIDRVSLIPGRGTLLEGRVAQGTLRGNASLEILGPQNNVLSTSVVTVYISNAVVDQVAVGDYARVLVQGIEATAVSPGMALAEAGAFPSYEEALQALQ